ncbi:hypothetical protein AB4Y40_16200 [Paraburkholderia sp. EG287B]|uniref:hypothetical protein n=1 Tax=Paraburkholderia sp. EG287B TaxID=3237010 RepID=UPI0034D22FCA
MDLGRGHHEDCRHAEGEGCARREVTEAIMCICSTGAHCACYGSKQQYREERARQASASALEWQVLDVLNGEPGNASPRAIEFATLLAPHRADLVDFMTAGDRVFLWLSDGSEHIAKLARPAFRMAA